jgi:hypothetical protein
MSKMTEKSIVFLEIADKTSLEDEKKEAKGTYLV